MFIKCQNGRLVNLQTVLWIQTGGFEESGCIIAKYPDDAWITLGEYNGKERAGEVMREIWTAIGAGYTSYRMPEE